MIIFAAEDGVMGSTNWDERYRTGDLPWDTNRHDKNLEEIVEQHSIGPCAALELGCGTGTNAIWLAGRGFCVTALDVSPVAIEMAREKTLSKGSSVEFLSADVLADEIPGAPFAFVFDRGCFHSFGDPSERVAFAEAVSGALSDGGLWLSLIGSADGPPREVGPPRESAREIVAVVEPLFEIISVCATHFDSDLTDPPCAWECLMRKRAAGTPTSSG